jgi:hypothetical protein
MAQVLEQIMQDQVEQNKDSNPGLTDRMSQWDTDKTPKKTSGKKSGKKVGKK